VNRRAVLFALGRLMQLMGGALLVPLALAVHDEWAGTPFAHLEISAFIGTILVSLVAGTLLTLVGRSARNEQGLREGFAIVTLGWVLLAFLGAIPFAAHFLGSRSPLGGDVLRAFTNAYFETMSGFTTTGASVIADVEALPRGLLFWRSLTHWLGGMGIITLALVLFPAMGTGGYQMFRSEASGPSADRLRPRLANTAQILWGVYAVFTALETMLLMLGGMSLFDAVCHSFATMATGGFSTRNTSVAAFQSAYVEWVVIAFMFLAGMNFLLHYRLIFRRDWSAVTGDREFRFYAAAVAAAVVLTVTLLVARGTGTGGAAAGAGGALAPDLPALVRAAVFQVLSITTTAGFATADYDAWPRTIGFVLVLFMLTGACAGSTAGGMKMIRILIAAKAAWREMRRALRPRLIAPIKIRGEALPESLVENVIGFLILYTAVFVFASGILSLFVPDLPTAVSAVATTMGNVGPGLGGVGPTQTFAWIPAIGKWTLIACMLLGRLEIFTVLILLRPSFWRR